MLLTREEGRYVYPTCTMIRCLVVSIWFRIPSNNCLHHYSISTRYNKKIMKSCGLGTLPDRRTFDRRFKSIPIHDITSAMGRRFMMEKLAHGTICAVDSTLIHAATDASGTKRTWYQIQYLVPE